MSALIAGGLLEIGKGLINRLFPDPEQKARAELELLRMQSEGTLKELEVSMSAILEEAKSEDPWTSRARPSFMYVFYVLLLSLVVITPILGVFFPEHMELFFTNVGRGFKAIPEELWWTFTAGYLGYTGFRSIEKRKGLKPQG